MSTHYTALVIDDNFFNRDIFRESLEAAEYVVKEAETGKDGLALLAVETFTLLVLDLQLPDMTGIDILKKVRADGTHDKMRVLVVTANPHMVTEFVENDTDYVMQKPINVMEFMMFAKRLHGL
jgi:DNA-binding response OmpR family regulator